MTYQDLSHLIKSNLIQSNSAGAAEKSGNAEVKNGSKPPYQPPASEENVWLDAVAPLTGAKDRKGLLNVTRWRNAAKIAITEGVPLPNFLKAVQHEYARPPDELRYVTPESCLKQARAFSKKPGKFTHEIP